MTGADFSRGERRVQVPGSLAFGPRAAGPEAIHCPLESLYGDIPPLESFQSPEYGQRFRYMSPREAVLLAHKVVKNILASGIKHIVVMEAGATRLARICQEIGELKNLDLRWTYLKIPRETGPFLCSMILEQLGDLEKESPPPEIFMDLIKESFKEVPSSRRQALEWLCERVPPNLPATELSLEEKLSGEQPGRNFKWTQAVQCLLKDTGAGSRFSGSLLILDEYVTSGTVLNNARFFLSLFSSNQQQRAGCYLLNVDSPGSYPLISFALFNRANRLSCFREGAYPFENRPDLTGELYVDKGREMRKVALTEFVTSGLAPETARFLSELKNLVTESGLPRGGAALFSEPINREHFCEADLLRLSLYVIESGYSGSHSAQAQFLFQLFEMYGPPWFPLPISIHKDFLEGAARVEPLLKSIFPPGFISGYAAVREGIISEVACLCLKRKADFDRTIRREITSMEEL